ncbi:TetR/AcrR family transcriptional regulator [Brachybacterium sp. FME24]|uniref:TetR/AcrR family transcriptional regulator n=1 Tax=Brachybacterium sp. FME24 TaxID=2742605 RepID=UPI0018682D0E|nr:TetR/AcrR family transcriptional regulator [Brachybacterium sp. FME24]
MVEPTARKQRTEERRRRILEVARERADADGWSAVTTRHLADAIGYTQPVLYGHFPGGKSEIMLTVAMEGFADLTQRCRIALEAADAARAPEVAALAYLDFGSAHPAVYEAMFQQAIDAKFDSDETPPALRAAFDLLSTSIGDDKGGAATEVFWGALHGISLLERAGRMRPEHRADRVAELTARFGA